MTSVYTGPVKSTATTISAIGSIIGSPQVGQTLTAGPLTPSAATATYQWQKSSSIGGPFTDIPGATSKSYVAKSNDYNYYLRVIATASGAYSGTATSTAVGPLTAQPLTGISNIIGTTAIGETLRAGTVMPYGATVTFQWQKSTVFNGTYEDIIGANSDTLVLTENEKYYYIKLKVTGTGSYSGTVMSAYSGPVMDPFEITNMEPIGAISGTTQVGETLTAGTLTPAGATATYQWKRASAIEGPYEDIEGATSSSYTLKANDFGYYIIVVATGSGTFSGIVNSSPVGAISAAPLVSIGNISGTTTTTQILTAGTLAPYGATATYQWMKSDAWDGVYTNISGATASTYTLTASDQSFYIKVAATGHSGYSGTVLSAYSGPVTSMVTPITAISAITGTSQVEQTLTVGALTPVNATATYQWQRSSTSGGPYTNITGATGSTYKLTTSDYNQYIKVVAKGSGIYSGTAESAARGPIVAYPLTAIATINGMAIVGQTLTAGELTPLGATATYQWKRLANSKQANPMTDTYTNIAGATSSTYLLTSAENNCYIKVEAIGTGAYTGSVTSYHTAIVGTVAQGIPLISIGDIIGITDVGGTLTAGHLSPAGGTATYQWQRSSTPNGTYANIPGANSSSYTTTSDDRDCYIKVVANGSGAYSGEVISHWAGPINPLPITAIGNIRGTTVIGETLTAGTLSPQNATATYRWQRASAIGGPYTDIVGAIFSTYKLTSADNNCYIRVIATGSGAYSGTVTSNATGPVIASATPITAIGAITGTTQVRQTLTAGALTPAEATVTYQWQRADTSGGTYTNIPGATSSTYTLTGNDYNKFIKVVAMGSGTYSSSVTSSPTSQAVAACPITSIGPTIGTARIGSTLTAGLVYPIGASVSYQWYSGPNENNLTLITGATSNTYTIRETAPPHHYVRVVVTGNIANGYTGTQQYTVPIAGTETLITAMAPIQGITQVGNTLTAGALTPSAATATYQWQRSTTINGTYANIIGATASTYTVTSADNGYFIRVVATGSGAYSGTVISGYTGPGVVTATQVTAIADIMGTTVVGQSLTAGTLSPANATVNYQWQSADTINGTYTSIAGATSQIYTLTANDLGKYMKVVATGYGAYSGTATSNATGPVTSTATAILSVGPITGIVQVGETLDVEVTPAGATATYQWQIFTEPGGIYENIAGANSKTYTLKAADYNYYIQVIVTGAGSYTGTFTASTSVKVAKMNITYFDAISDIDAGTAGSATYEDASEIIAILPATVTANSNEVAVPVVQWIDTDSYDPNTAGSYTFTAVLGNIPDGYENTNNYTATVEVVIDEAMGMMLKAPEATEELVIEDEIVIDDEMVDDEEPLDEEEDPIIAEEPVVDDEPIEEIEDPIVDEEPIEEIEDPIVDEEPVIDVEIVKDDI